jgi:gamma-glutamylcyclotransferase (GGCT)/AIG2-like uncharacterized protein YtfP
MNDRVFFYGTLRRGFDRTTRAGLDDLLTFLGRGSIQARLFDLGIYPAAVPAAEGLVWGEIFEMKDVDRVLSALDEIEGYSEETPDSSLYTRSEVPVRLDDGRTEHAWAYFYNAPLGQAPEIRSGDYLEYLRVK